MAATSVITRKSAPKTESVVTPERFAQGYDSFQSWMGNIELNKDNFQRHYDEWEPDQGDVDAIKALVQQHGVKALLLGEDWCPDVWRGLPVLARLSEMTGLEARFFKRDENKDIMAEFLKDGEFESIPTVVFYDRDHNYLGHWIERADLANAEMPKIREVLAGKEQGTPEHDEAMQVYRARTWDHAEGWRDAQVSETRALLEEALG